MSQLTNDFTILTTRGKELLRNYIKQWRKAHNSPQPSSVRLLSSTCVSTGCCCRQRQVKAQAAGLAFPKLITKPLEDKSPTIINSPWQVYSEIRFTPKMPLYWSPVTSRGLFYTDSLLATDSLFWPPWRKAGDVRCLLPVWNLGAVIRFHFAISSFVLLPSPVTHSVLSFSARWPFLLNFFHKILQYFSLRDRHFCMAPV